MAIYVEQDVRIIDMLLYIYDREYCLRKDDMKKTPEKRDERS